VPLRRSMRTRGAAVLQQLLRSRDRLEITSARRRLVL
jgi:hypothetical protein